MKQTVMRSTFLAFLIFIPVALTSPDPPPNVVLFIIDDLGIGDVGAFGNTTIRTDTIDGICDQGVKLTHNIAASGTCSPSRTALMTARLGIRSGMAEVVPSLMSYSGLSRNEWTLPQMMKHEGYATGLVGKWHLGWNKGIDDQHYHPHNYGFDFFYGLPFTLIPDYAGKKSHFASVNPYYWAPIVKAAVVGFVSSLLTFGLLSKRAGFFLMLLTLLSTAYFLWVFNSFRYWNGVLVDGRKVIEQPLSLENMTPRLIEQGQKFLRSSVDEGKPAFLVMSWLHVHSPLHPIDKFKGKSKNGHIGDALEETDWAMNEIMKTLKDLDMADNTLIYFTSDHGSDTHDVDHDGILVGGYNGRYRGSKAEGGQEGIIRTPTCIQWPGKLKSGKIVDRPTTHMDLMVTLAEILGTHPPRDRPIDGKNILPLLKGESNRSPHEFLLHYSGSHIDAVRYIPPEGSAIYKMHYRWPNVDMSTGRRFANYSKNANAFMTLPTPLLFNIEEDPYEEAPLDTDAEPYKSIVGIIEEKKAEHIDSVTGSLPSTPVNFYRDVANPLRNPYLHYLAHQFFGFFKFGSQ